MLLWRLKLCRKAEAGEVGLMLAGVAMLGVVVVALSKTLRLEVLAGRQVDAQVLLRLSLEASPVGVTSKGILGQAMGSVSIPAPDSMETDGRITVVMAAIDSTTKVAALLVWTMVDIIMVTLVTVDGGIIDGLR